MGFKSRIFGKTVSDYLQKLSEDTDTDTVHFVHLIDGDEHNSYLPLATKNWAIDDEAANKAFPQSWGSRGTFRLPERKGVPVTVTGLCRVDTGGLRSTACSVGAAVTDVQYLRIPRSWPSLLHEALSRYGDSERMNTKVSKMGDFELCLTLGRSGEARVELNCEGFPFSVEYPYKVDLALLVTNAAGNTEAED